MRKFLLTLLIALPLQVASEVTPEPSKSAAIVFRPSEGKTTFLAIGKPSMIKINGEGQGPEGNLQVHKNTLNGSLKVDLNQLTTKIELRDDHMKNKYLEVAKYPAATLELVDLQLPTDFTSLPETDTEVPFKGKFTMHGKTSDISGKATIRKKANDVTGSAEFGFKITDHLDTLPSWLGVKVAENVTVKVQLKGSVQ